MEIVIAVLLVFSKALVYWLAGPHGDDVWVGDHFGGHYESRPTPR